MAETIKEFLVGLGYKVDGASESKFLRSVEGATKAVGAMALSLVAATGAVSAAITKIAANFDDLYWSSQRTKASAENIKALGYAVSQLGGSYQGAVSSIEEFARRMRSNPGYEAMARNLGVVTRENGKLRDSTSIMTDLAKVLSKKPQYVALQYLEALGIDEATYNALKSGDLVRYTEEYRKKQQALGVDQQRAAEIGKDLTNAWRALGATAQTVGEKLMQELGPGLKDFVERVDAFLMRNSDRIVEFFKKAAELVGKLMDAFVQLVEKGEGPIVAMFDKIMKSVDSLEKVLVAFAAFLVGSWLVSILGAFARVGSGWAALLLKLGISPTALLAGGAIAALSGGPANGGEDAEIARRRAEGTWGKTPNDGTPGAPPQITDKRNWWQRTMPKWMGGKDAPAATGGSNAPIRGSTFTQKSPGIMKRLMDDFGLTREQAAGVMGNLGHESGGLNVMQERNPTAGRGGWGWAQWTGPRRRAFEAWAAANGLDPSSDEANYGFLRHELRTSHRRAVNAVKQAGSVEEATVAFELAYEQAGIKNYPSRNKWAHRALRAAERSAANSYAPPYVPFSGINAGSLAAVQSNAALFGSGITPALTPGAGAGTNVDMQQKTEITILGGSDPQATASAVSDAQNGVNGRLLRNMQGATR